MLPHNSEMQVVHATTFDSYKLFEELLLRLNE